MSQETLQRVREMIAGYLGISADKVAADSRLEDLGLDSLGAYELVFQIEEEFEIVVPNERAAEFETVQAICDGIEALRATART